MARHSFKCCRTLASTSSFMQGRRNLIVAFNSGQASRPKSCSSRLSYEQTWRQTKYEYEYKNKFTPAPVASGRYLCSKIQQESQQCWPPKTQQRFFGGINNQGSSLKALNQTHIDAFRELLNHKNGSVLTDKNDVDSYNTDWMVSYITFLLY